VSENYSLFQPLIIQHLTQGDVTRNPKISKEKWFEEAISEAYGTIAERYNCEVEIAERRILEAQKYWMHDLSRIIIDGGSDKPDQFKNAGFLAYWLRRRVIVDTCSEIAGRPVTANTKNLLEYPNEILSFMVGFRICLFFEVDPRPGEKRTSQLAIELDLDYLKEVGVLLAHKNLSPHSLYVIYRSLFYPFRGALY